MSALVLHYTFEAWTLSGDNITVSNASIGAPSYNATLSPQTTVSTTVYRVGTQSLACNNDVSGLALPPFYTNTTTSTFALWFRATTAANATLMTLSDTSSNKTFSLQLTSASLLAMTYNNGTASASFNSSTSTYVVGRWHHVVWTVQQGKWQLFLDGWLVSTVTSLAIAIDAPPTQFTFAFIGSSFQGYIDDVRVYSTLVSADQIYDLFHRATCKHYYRFEVDDISGNTMLNYASPHAALYDCSFVDSGTNAFNTSSTTFGITSATVAAGGGALCYTPTSTTATNYVALPPLENQDPSGSTFALWCYTNDTLVNGPMTLFALTSSTACYRCSYDSCYNSLVFARTDAGGQGFVTTQLANVTTPRATTSSFLPYNPVTKGTWHYVVWSIAPTYWKIWIDGIATTLVSTSSCFASSSSFTTLASLLTALPPVFTGPNTLLYSVGAPFNGYIDDVRYMNRVVSDDDVRWLYTTGCVRTNFYDASGNDFLHLYATSSTSSSFTTFVAAANTGHKIESGKDIGATFGVTQGASAIKSPPYNVNYFINGSVWVSSVFASVEPVLPFVATGTNTIIDYGTGQYTVVFTDYGTLQVGNTINTVDVVCVGGGGGGGSSSTATFGGGGGAGGSVTSTAGVAVSPYTSYACDVGRGGLAGETGVSTSFLTVSAAGGGAGGNATSSSVGTGSATTNAGSGGNGSVAGSAGVAVA